MCKFIRELNELMTDRDIIVTATEQLIDQIIAVGVDAKMGARPLARTVDDIIKLPLSRKLLFDEIQPGTRLTLDWVNNQLDIKENVYVPETA